MLLNGRDHPNEKDLSKEKGKLINKGDQVNKENQENKGSLKDKVNKRISATHPTNKEDTAAWQSAGSHDREDAVNKPSIERVIDAKDWVDNGSRL